MAAPLALILRKPQSCAHSSQLILSFGRVVSLTTLHSWMITDTSA